MLKPKFKSAIFCFIPPNKTYIFVFRSFHRKKNVRIASIINITINHFATSIEKPAIPCAPNIYATSANIKKTTAKNIKSTIFYSPKLYYLVISY